MALVHDGFGGYIDESELPEDYVHGGYVDLPSIAAPDLDEIAKDAIASLQDLLDDVRCSLSYEAYNNIENWQHHNEQLVYLQQALKEADRGE